MKVGEISRVHEIYFKYSLFTVFLAFSFRLPKKAFNKLVTQEKKIDFQKFLGRRFEFFSPGLSKSFLLSSVCPRDFDLLPENLFECPFLFIFPLTMGSFHYERKFHPEGSNFIFFYDRRSIFLCRATIVARFARVSIPSVAFANSVPERKINRLI